MPTSPVAQFFAIAAWAIALLNTGAFGYAWHSLVRFQRDVPAIQTNADLAAYKALATRLMLVVAMMLAGVVAWPLLMVGGGALGVDVGWGPLIVLVLPMLMRKRVHGLETAVRTLPVADSLAAAYAGITRVWIERLLPRFDDTPLTPVGILSKHECTKHGMRTGNTCARCRTSYCVECAREIAAAPNVCSDCQSVYVVRAKELDGAFRATFRTGHVLGALGLGDLVVGMVWLQDPLLSGAAFGMIVLGISTNIASLLWSSYSPVGRTASMVAAALHLPVIPVGTVVGLWSLRTAIHYAAAVTREATEAAMATNIVRSRGVVWSIVVGSIVVFAHTGNLVLYMGIVVAFLR